MKLQVFFSIFFFLLFSTFCFGQWDNNANSIYNTNSGNVGIGTDTPTRLLHAKTGQGTSIIARMESQHPNGATIDFRDSNTTGDWKARIGGKGDGLTFIAGGMERMNVLYNGSVGIGTVTPSRLFHAKTGQETSIIARMESQHPNGATIDFKDSNTTGDWQARIGGKGDGLTFIAGGIERMNVLHNGSVGIGTDTPTRLLHAKTGQGTSIIARMESQHPNGATIDFKDSNTTGDWQARIGGKGDGLTFIAGGIERMNVLQNGSIGIGTDTPTRLLHAKTGQGTSIIARMESQHPNGATIDFKDSNTTGDWQARIGGKGDGLTFIAGGIERMNVLQNGSIGIGVSTIPADYKLAVDGKIICEELRVNLSQNWPDYVFDENYNLMPLEEVEKVIDQKGHLPGIPSAQEIEKAGGIEVGEMQRLMMEKIEEMTLYMIELKKENEKLHQEIEELKK